MISGKELALEEVIKEMNKLKYRLLDLSEKLHIGFFEIRAITYKEIMSNTNYKGDIMLNKVIKADDTREEFDAVKESYNAYREVAINKIGEMLETKSKGECIVYLKDKIHWKWKQIAKLVDLSDRQCQNLYNKEKNK